MMMIPPTVVSDLVPAWTNWNTPTFDSRICTPIVDGVDAGLPEMVVLGFYTVEVFWRTRLAPADGKFSQNHGIPLAGCRENIERLVAWHIRFGKPKREPVVGRMAK